MTFVVRVGSSPAPHTAAVDASSAFQAARSLGLSFYPGTERMLRVLNSGWTEEAKPRSIWTDYHVHHTLDGRCLVSYRGHGVGDT